MVRKHKRMYLSLFYLIITLLILIGVYRGGSGRLWGKVKIDSVKFKETAQKLDNPNRGFYYIYDFWITDEQTDYRQLVAERYEKDTDTELTMLQICLQDYHKGEITEAGIRNIDALFQAMEETGKQLIVRFVYDREGKNLQYEPQDIDIILRHMEQLENTLRKYSHRIFILQGLFVGNWGEMHGTRYDSWEDFRVLAKKLDEVTEQSIYLAVRTPAQWRAVTGLDGLTGRSIVEDDLASRLGLFNDGMLGNETDYGTYGTENGLQEGSYAQRSRKEELQFQSALCDKVPNGGEVIVPNPYNDIDNAVADMSSMRVTYLNREYDGSVFDKWEKSIVRERSVFDGMDGCTYIERHLGYRIFIDKTKLSYRFWKNCLHTRITLKNVGFAPVYREPDVHLTLYNVEDGEFFSQKITCSLRKLTGGGNRKQSLTIQTDVELAHIPEGQYKIYFEMIDPATGKRIQLANEPGEEVYGYLIGELEYQ